VNRISCMRLIYRIEESLSILSSMQNEKMWINLPSQDIKFEMLSSAAQV
jgi:hypothetical protein